MRAQNLSFPLVLDLFPNARSGKGDVVYLFSLDVTKDIVFSVICSKCGQVGNISTAGPELIVPFLVAGNLVVYL